MRQGQQHRRGRSRNNNNNNNRKGQNPLTRNFESSGPDVKIRGTPAHVAEKYMSLARDALSSGDPVLAENYLQHAEHYNRIILAYREQQVSQSAEQSNGSGRGRNAEAQPDADNQPAASADEAAAADGAQPAVQPGDPQPSINSTGDGNRSERTEGRRQPRARSGGQRSPRGEGRKPREPREPREPRRRERERDSFGDSDQQPDFLKRPVRRTRAESKASEPAASDAPAAPEPADGGQQD
ncbi:MAG: DUF4167 domain-containing protein [Alphaproteobacteria bacterium]|nr:DUF4167 domain-containing protein [Alphaproteobacteria bacterium]